MVRRASCCPPLAPQGPKKPCNTHLSSRRGIRHQGNQLLCSRNRVLRSHPTSVRKWHTGLQHPMADLSKYTFLEGPWIGPSICYAKAGAVDRSCRVIQTGNCGHRLQKNCSRYPTLVVLPQVGLTPPMCQTSCAMHLDPMYLAGLFDLRSRATHAPAIANNTPYSEALWCPRMPISRLRAPCAGLPSGRVACGCAVCNCICCGWAFSANCLRGTYPDCLKVALTPHVKA